MLAVFLASGEGLTAVKCLFTDGGARHSADGAGGGRVDKELLKTSETRFG